MTMHSVRRDCSALPRVIRGTSLLLALAVTAACGGKEPAAPAKGEKAPSAATAPTPDGLPTNISPGKTMLGEIVIKEATQDYARPQLNRNVSNMPLSIAGKKYATGIGTHANARVRIVLPAGTRALSGACGVDDYVETRGSVVFRILDGEKVLYKSGLLKGKMPAESFDVNVGGATELTLVVDDGGDGNTSDHGDWVDLAIRK